MQYLLWISIIIMGIIRKNSRLVYAVQLSWFTIAWGLTLDTTVDVINYYSHYLLVNPSPSLYDIFFKEELHKIVWNFMREMGMSFLAVRFVFGLFCVMLVMITINRYTQKNRCLILSLAAVFPMLNYVVEIQGRVAMCIIFFALRYLEKKSLNNFIKFIICIAVAGGFHTGAWEFLALLAVMFVKDTKNMFWISMAGVSLEIVLIDKLPFVFSMLGIQDRTSLYTLQLGYYKMLGLIVWQIAFLAVVCFNTNFFIQRGKVLIRNDGNFLLRTVFATFLLYPLCYYSLIYFRFLRYCVIFTYIVLAQNMQFKKKAEFGILGAVLFSVISLLFFHIRSVELFVNSYLGIVVNGNQLAQDFPEKFVCMILFILMSMMYYLLNNRKLVNRRKIVIPVKE